VPELPSGTVTFLFSDVEGSTRLLQELGEGYAEVLGEHRRALREAFRRHGGVEVDTQGDAFFVAFAKASDALAAAREGREALTASPIRVRMGLHTGEPVVTEEGYVGIDVHRAARIAAAGHGGQILVSQSTRDLAGADGLRDLGEHRLKDLTAPERIYQLGGGDFPALKSLNQSNLPVQPTPLVGREHELREIGELLHSCRLLTLTGAGGSGKTRLALQAAAEVVDEFPDGVWFVPLASLTDPQLVESAIAEIVGAREDLADFLRGRQLLLLLDNLEQLLPELAPIVASLDARILATSRERLDLAVEQEYEVPTLPLDDAVALFTQRARQLRSNFEPDEYVTQIAFRLDGLPLALELAAALVKVLTPKQISSRLEHALDVLTAGTRDAPERQRTLRATIEWSYELLSAEEQRLFAELAVFAGSFEFEAAETVAAAELEVVRALVDKSLLRQTGEGRFFMLETIREYAAERLEGSGTADATRRRHAEWVEGLAMAAREDLRGDRQVEVLDQLTAEHANVRAALTFAIASGDAQVALGISGSLGRYWAFRGHLREGRHWLEAALALPKAAADEVRWRALYWESDFAASLGDRSIAVTASEAGLAIARELGNATAVGALAQQLARTLLDEGDSQRAEALLEEAAHLAAQEGDQRGTAELAFVRGRVLLRNGDPSSAASLFEECLELDRQSGDTQGAVVSLAYLAFSLASGGNVEPSRQRLRESLQLCADLGYALGVAICLQVEATLALAEDDASLAAALLLRAEGLLDSFGGGLMGVEAELYRQPWSDVRDRVGDTKLESIRIATPAGDVDEALAFAFRYLD
jgi:predicted ATPase